MKKVQILSKPTKVADLTLEDLYDEPINNWHEKAQKLQIRRWRMLKRAIKGDRYVVSERM